MAQLKYVGLKQACTHFLRETGITWTPGVAHDVPDAVASRMLQHPDIFALAGPGNAGVKVSKAPGAPAPTAAPAPASVPAPALSLASLSTDGAPDPSGLSLAPGAAIGATAPAPSPTTASTPDLATMEAPALHALAKDMGLKVHHAAGAAKVREAIKAAQKAAAKAKK